MSTETAKTGDERIEELEQENAVKGTLIGKLAIILHEQEEQLVFITGKLEQALDEVVKLRKASPCTDASCFNCKSGEPCR